MYRNFAYRKQTKLQFARDDPAFLVLLAGWLVVSSAFFSYELGIGVEMIKTKPVRVTTNPNAATTGGSAGSECNCVAAIEACKILKARLEPIRAEVGPDATWSELIKAANEAEVDLCARYM